MFIKDLGELEGPILVFGGVYSNLHALNAFINIANKHDIPPQNVICTGDVVAYCADSLACVERIVEYGCPVLAGNCEKQLALDAEDCGCGFDTGSTCSLMSRAWYAHAQTEMTNTARTWMDALPDRITFTHLGKRYVVVHGGASDISRFVWPVTPAEEIKHEINLLWSEVGSIDCVLAGHTGIVMQQKVDDVDWINAGAIGMPANNGNPTTSYIKMDADGIEVFELDYDYLGAKQEMEKVGLMQGYHDCLQTGFWPSEETLPPEMRRNQSAKG